MWRAIFLLFLAVGFSGCVSSKSQPLSDHDAAELSGSRLVLTKRSPPAFDDISASDGMKLGLGVGVGGIVGGAIAGGVDYGTQVINNERIQDPAIQIQQALASTMAKRYQMRMVDNSRFSVLHPKVEDVTADFETSADYVLDVETTRWLSVYLPAKWLRYRVVYHAHARLYAVDRQEPLAEAFVVWQTPEESGFPTYEELYGSGATGLKEQLQMAAEYAIDYISENMLP